MNTTDTKVLLAQVHEIHDAVEKAYIAHPATKGADNWLEKRKFLLADLSLHMVHAALQEPVDKSLVQRYLYSLLTISHDFLPDAGLLDAAEKLVPSLVEVK